MRLHYFDLTRGGRIAMEVLSQEMGKWNAVKMGLRLQYCLRIHHPFQDINQIKTPTRKEKLSQRQMAPMVVLYQLLLKDGYSQEAALNILSKVANEVAVAFLKFNIPDIRKSQMKGKEQSQKLRFLHQMVSRFFNAEGTINLSENDDFYFTVNRCYFASYAKQLNVPELGPIFCASDRVFFEKHQKEILFKRSQTLAIDQKPCDFSFHWTSISA